MLLFFTRPPVHSRSGKTDSQRNCELTSSGFGRIFSVQISYCAHRTFLISSSPFYWLTKMWCRWYGWHLSCHLPRRKSRRHTINIGTFFSFRMTPMPDIFRAFQGMQEEVATKILISRFNVGLLPRPIFARADRVPMLHSPPRLSRRKTTCIRRAPIGRRICRAIERQQRPEVHPWALVCVCVCVGVC
jgi:hypothetical protein